MESRWMERFNKTELDEGIKQFFTNKGAEKKYIFGGGGQSRILIELCRDYEIELAGIIVSERSNAIHEITRNMLREDQLYYWTEMSEEEKRESEVLIGVNEKNNGSISDMLRQGGCLRIACSADWNKTNSILRQVYFEDYLQQRGFQYIENKQVLEYEEGELHFKIANNEDNPTYHSMLIGEWNDIIAPSLLDEYDNAAEGPYEYGKVRLSAGDTVFDLGSNIGMFSCVAAAKGCTAYAFEPNPITIHSLELNVKLNPSIQICPYAACEKRGKVKFYINTSDQNEDSGTASLYDRNAGYTEIEVEAVTLDELVKEKNIDRVDFIKSDIEGAERYMLMGAQEILRKYAPKLALCTYHLPDDKEVMEKLILQANPDYIIEHKWMKLYAYVPDKKK